MKQNERNLKRGSKQNERTRQMMMSYMDLHFDEGLTPLEIAERFSLSPSTVYDSLWKIASENGVSRDSLLKHPGRGNFGHLGGKFGYVKPVDPTIFRKKLRNLESTLSELKKAVKENIWEEEK